MGISAMFYLILAVLVLAFFAVILFLIIVLLKKKNTSGQENVNDSLVNRDITAEEIVSSAEQHRQALVDVIACSGVNPKPASYMVLDDSGHSVYVRCFTIDRLPKQITFSKTFSSLVNFPGVRTRYYIVPETEDVTTTKLDRQIVILDGEQQTAIKNKEINRVRSVSGQLQEVEQWVDAIEKGYQKFFNVAFLFILERDTLEDLNRDSDSFYREALKKQIDISSTFACTPEAFLTGAPYVKIFPLTFGKIKQVPIPWHALSRAATADLFCHICSDFRHKDGVPIGRTLDEFKPVLYNPFAETHFNGYGAIFSGKTGSGKTSAIKILSKRLYNTNSKYRYAIIDSQRRGNRGEYSSLADDLNGVRAELKHGSGLIINLCEVCIQREYDEVVGIEYDALHLAERKTVIVWNLLVLIQGQKKEMDFNVNTYIERILADIVDECFKSLGIEDGKPESLYTYTDTLNDNGEFVKKKVKKELPTITMIYKKVLSRFYGGADARHHEALGIILDSLKDRVHWLAYCVVDQNVMFLKKEICDGILEEDGIKPYILDGIKYPIIEIEGDKDYFDGQSTFEFSPNCACTTFDISGLPEKERCEARQIVMSFITEEFSATNSQNFSGNEADNLVVILDENQENYKYPYMRQCIDTAYRTNRKRHVSVWISQQALSDGSQYDEISQGVIHNTAIFFLFKQPFSDKEFLKKNTVLNDRQIERTTTIGLPDNLSDDPDEALAEMKQHIGECCLIDGSKVCFMKFEVLEESEKALIASNKNTLDELYKQMQQQKQMQA